MKKYITLLCITVVSILAYADVDRFFIGNIEVSQQDFMAIDSTLIRAKGVWAHEDTTIHSIIPGIYARIDSLSQPGKVFIVKKSEAEIYVIDSILNAYRTESSILKIGDTIPDFKFHDYISKEETWDYDRNIKGKVVLLNFWATWCGPCIEELKHQSIPSIVENYNTDKRFLFLPVSVNHDSSELDQFFKSSKGIDLNWLKYKTAWDKNGKFAETVSNGGIPLTLLIDTDGVIRLNESGAFTTEESLLRLQSEINKLLEN